MSITTSTRLRTRTRMARPMLAPLWNAAGCSLPIREEGRFTCGAAASNDLILQLDGVASQHCLLHFTNGQLSIERTGGNIWINDLPVNTTGQLEFGDVLSIGPASFRIDRAESFDSHEPASRDLLDDSDSLSDQSSSQNGMEEIADKPDPDTFQVQSALGDEQYHALLQLQQQARDEAERDTAARQQMQASLESLERQLAKLSESISTREATVEVSDRASDDASAAIQAATHQIERLDKVCEQRFEKLETLESRLQERIKWLQEREAAVADEESRLLARISDSQEAYRQLTAAQQAASQNEHRLQMQQARIDSRETELSQREASILNREQVTQKLESALNDQAAELKLISERLSEREQTLEQQQHDVDRALASVHHAEQELDARATEHAAAELRLAEDTEALEAQKADLQTHLQTVQTREHAVADAESALASRQEELTAQDDELKKERQAIEEQGQRLVEQGQRIAELEAALDARQLEIEEQISQLSVNTSDLEIRTAQHQAAVEQAEQHAAELNAQKADLEAEKASLQNSRADFDAQVAQWQTEQAEFDQKCVQLELREQQLTADELALQNREQQLTADELALQNREQQLTADEVALQNREQQATADELALQNREQQLTADELALQNREQQLKERESEQSEFANQAAGKADDATKRLSEVQSELLTLQTTAAEQSALLKTQQEQLTSIREQLNASERVVADQAQQLQAIKLKPPVEDSVSVQQMSALANDREMLLREKEQLAANGRRLEQRSRDLEAFADEIANRDSELQARSEELWKRLQKLKAISAQNLAASVDRSSSEEELAKQAEALEALHSRIDRENAELDLKLTELADQVEQIAGLRAEVAETKQWIDVRTSELNQREQELHARLLAIKQAAKSATSAQAASEQQLTDLHAAEILQLQEALELQRQTADAKEQQLNNQMASLHGLIESLQQQLANEADTESQQAQIDQLAAERDSLLNALKDLQGKFEDIRADLESAEQLRLELAELQERTAAACSAESGYQHEISALQADAAVASEELQQSFARIKELEHLVETLQLSVSAADQASEQSATRPELGQIDDEELKLLQQVNEIRKSLEESLQDANSRAARFEDLLAERDEQLRLAQQQLDVQSDKAAEPDQASLIEGLEQQISTLKASLGEREQLIQQLRDQLQQLVNAQPSPLAGGATNAEELQIVSRELDRRAELLDSRDNELKSYAAKLELTESELETQRRQMLEARQQLEIARADIQVAMQQASTSSIRNNSDRAASINNPEQPVAEDDQSNDACGASGGPSSDHNDATNYRMTGDEHQTAASEIEDESVSHLRTELANLFGVSPKAKPTNRDDETLDAMFVDPSQPVAKLGVQGISISFDDNTNVLLEQPRADDSAENEEDTPDFVTNYMEELLARSRNSAGASLPAELRGSGTSTRTVERKTEPVQPKPFQQKSFIEQYMAGNNTVESTPATDSVEYASEPASREPAAPRAKIDREKLRASMDSFRNVSSMSVENALSSAARRKESSSIYARGFFAVTLVLIALAQVVATVAYGFWQPYLLLVSIFGAIGVCTELAMKLSRIKKQFQGVLGSRKEERPLSPLGASVPVSTEAADQDGVGPATDDSAIHLQNTTQSDGISSPEAVEMQNALPQDAWSDGIAPAEAINGATGEPLNDEPGIRSNDAKLPDIRSEVSDLEDDLLH